MIISKKSDSEINFHDALKLFTDACNFKYKFWFNTKILPIYITHGFEHVTKPVITDTFEKFKTDTIASLHPALIEKLKQNYFSDDKAIEIYLKEFFYNRINDFEIKNSKIATTTSPDLATEIGKG